mmetsp:Transcript_60322/g.143701  ORF Transcript_60322/g.143701 Transcript_60322/m.143701 type:complete len:335 (-) Transcript_60322:126-1130(-)|eukprot:CAMPEP_0178412246 /NCGR_PEP_ID=MMETSP0689_2-20121128/21917_1 /TAXON_ID=160604 /ORGANISM="Amphidinium massartii, Strain CS-259" /LENGTH=334 /DNA_ID=CAMNT_0020033489 /DNA_START=65 /DNA_END=1069 /DNA_ORIENTATION=-
MARGNKEREQTDPKSSVKAPPKKSGGGGKYTMGRPGDEARGAELDEWDPAYDPDERRTDPEDGVAYTFSELKAFYKGKFKPQAIQEYWQYECKPVKSSKKTKPMVTGPTVAESAKKAKKKAEAKPKPQGKRLTPEDMTSEGPLAKEIAGVIPYFPFKGIEKFYDIQGLMKYPKLFNALCAVMAKRYRKRGVTKLAAFEARGFLFSPVAIKLGVPFIMLRKGGKMPNCITSEAYSKEYEGTDVLAIQKGTIVKDDKVVLLDDLLATGGTMGAGISLIKACEAEVVECACVVEIKALNGAEKCKAAGAQEVWSFLAEDLLTLKAELPEDYKDDGAK